MVHIDAVRTQCFRHLVVADVLLEQVHRHELRLEFLQVMVGWPSYFSFRPIRFLTAMPLPTPQPISAHTPKLAQPRKAARDLTTERSGEPGTQGPQQKVKVALALCNGVIRRSKRKHVGGRNPIMCA